MTTRIDMAYLKRLTAIRRKFSEWNVDGLLVTSRENRRWISGFSGSTGQLLITLEKALLAVDFRYWVQAKVQAPDFTFFKHNRTDEANAAFIAEANVAKIGIEAQFVTLLEKAKLSKIEGVDWVLLPVTAESLREIKSQAEIETMRAAAAITDTAMSRVNDIARLDMSERALAWELEKMMREEGADGMAFDIIVASGPNAALPHHQPGDRQLQAGDSLIVDMGAKIDGYHSDLTRSFYLGSEPDDKFWEIYDIVQNAQTAVLDNLKPGQSGKVVDALARDVIVDAGYGKEFGHGLGHGVGLFIHEDPRLSPRSEKSVISPNMTLTIEPGIYLPDWGGVRIEDLIVVTDNGYEYVSHCPKTPIIPVG